MTLMMRILLWAKQAPRSHVVTTAVTVTMSVILLGFVAIPSRPSAAPLGSEGQIQEPPLQGPAAGASSGATPGTGPTPLSGIGTAPAGPGPGGRTGSSSGSLGGTRRGSERPIASDRGITATTMKLGFLIVETAGTNASNAALSRRTDQEQAIKAYVDAINKQGGIQGRRITYVTAPGDPINASTQRAACLKMTQDEAVFAVIDTAATTGVTDMCYAENRTLHFTAAGQTMSEGEFRESRGYNVSYAASGSRVLLNWVPFMEQAGYIGPKGKGVLGILDDECAPDPEMMDREFKPLLRRHGIPFEEARLSCDLATAQQQIPNAVQQFRQKNVDRVFLATIFPNAQVFIQTAQAQAWRPLYSASDFWGMAENYSTSAFPPSEFNGALAPSFNVRIGPKGVPYLNEKTKRCSAMLTASGVPPITDPADSDAEVTSLCDSFLLFRESVAKTSINPTRSQVISAVQTIDSYLSTYSARTRFAPGKFNGGDAYAMLRWSSDCTCWQRTGKFRDAYV